MRLFCKGSFRQGDSIDFYIRGITFLDLYFRKIIPYSFPYESECTNDKILLGQRYFSTNSLVRQTNLSLFRPPFFVFLKEIIQSRDRFKTVLSGRSLLSKAKGQSQEGG